MKKRRKDNFSVCLLEPGNIVISLIISILYALVFLVIYSKNSLSGQHIMDEPVMPWTGACMMTGLAGFVAELERMEVTLPLGQYDFVVIQIPHPIRQKMINIYHILPFGI